MTTVAATSTPFHYVEEQDAFLALFPHRYDYLYAAYPSQTCSRSYIKPQWRTERRFPLSDRMIKAGEVLYGVRFGRETRYCLIDIDIGSRYHPATEPFALTPIQDALESLGLVAYVICTSSTSGGLHLYIPFQQPHPSWLVGLTITQTLKQAGIWVSPGQVEVFPNYKSGVADSATQELSPAAPQNTLFNGHRLPLQIGSYLLDNDAQPIGSDRPAFVAQWRFCEAQNQLNEQALRRILYSQRSPKRLYSQRVKKFFNDLNIEIEAGWTGHGQTNRLLGRIAMRSYIFHHVMHGGEPLESMALVSNIAAVARSLPGYEEWCQHQHEIEERAAEWARAVENSHYFHYGDRPSTSSERVEPEAPNLLRADWNTQLAEKTQSKIRDTIKNLWKTNQLPNGVTARFKVLVQSGIGGASLYKYKELWHPNYLDLDSLSNQNHSQLPSQQAEPHSAQFDSGNRINLEPKLELIVLKSKNLDSTSAVSVGLEDLEKDLESVKTSRLSTLDLMPNPADITVDITDLASKLSREQPSLDESQPKVTSLLTAIVSNAFWGKGFGGFRTSDRSGQVSNLLWCLSLANLCIWYAEPLLSPYLFSLGRSPP